MIAIAVRIIRSESGRASSGRGDATRRRSRDGRRMNVRNAWLDVRTAGWLSRAVWRLWIPHRHR
jgi:hypothetical protein